LTHHEPVQQAGFEPAGSGVAVARRVLSPLLHKPPNPQGWRQIGSTDCSVEVYFCIVFLASEVFEHIMRQIDVFAATRKQAAARYR
jgi:hypothetical protein